MSERFPFGVDLMSKLEERPQINHNIYKRRVLNMDEKGCIFSSMLTVPSVHLYTLKSSICDPIGGVAFEFPHTNKWVGFGSLNHKVDMIGCYISIVITMDEFT